MGDFSSKYTSVLLGVSEIDPQLKLKTGMVSAV